MNPFNMIFTFRFFLFYLVAHDQGLQLSASVHCSRCSDRKCATSTQLLCPLLPTCCPPSKNQLRLDVTSGPHLVHHPTHSRANPHGVSQGKTLSESNWQGASHVAAVLLQLCPVTVPAGPVLCN